MSHCCDVMEYYSTGAKGVLKYSPATREYKFILYNTPGKLGYQEITYCHWCGSRLPQSLGKEWYEAVKQDLGLEDVEGDAEEWAKLPEKYKTEQWWREKGL